MKLSLCVVACALSFILGVHYGSDAECILPGTIREVTVNGVTWRGVACDTVPGVCIRDAKRVGRE